VNDPAAAAPPSYGDDRDWLLRFAPAPQTSALSALFAVEHQVLESLRPDLEHQVAHVRLEWWQEELARLAQGTPRHPATRTLAAASRSRGATPADLSGLVEHVRVDLASVAFLSRAELDEHLGNWGASVFREAALSHPDVAVATARRAAAERLCADAGRAVRELELLGDFSRHARAGRIYVPLGEAPQSHECWLARPLGAVETSILQQRRAELRETLCRHAQAIEPSHLPTLRVPLLWMAFAAQASASDRAPASPLRRTMSAWRDALAISRGRLPAALR
jgi:phytoene/squalene synthetase